MPEPDERKKPRDTGIDPGIFEIPLDLADLASGFADGDFPFAILFVGLVLIVPLLIIWSIFIVWRTIRWTYRAVAS